MEKDVVKESDTVDFTLKTYPIVAERIYPSRMLSRVLSLKNLWLPFHNRRAAVLLGLIYFLFAWTFVVSDPDKSPIAQKFADQSTIVQVLAEPAKALAKAEAETARQAAASAVAQAKLLGDRAETLAKEPGALTGAIDAAKAEALAAKETERAAKEAEKAKKELAATVDERAKVLAGRARDAKPDGVFANLMEFLGPRRLFVAATSNPFFMFMLLGLWAGFIFYVDLASGWLGTIGKIVIGTLHFAAHLVALLLVAVVAVLPVVIVLSVANILLLASGMPPVKPAESLTVEIVSVVSILLTTVVVGGLIGGLIVGLYWTLTSTLAKMHANDSFSALGLRDYKHFLRMHFEQDQVTIYPIAIDKVPGRRGWRKPTKGEAMPGHNPQIIPETPLRPRLIEAPIVIKAAVVVSPKAALLPAA